MQPKFSNTTWLIYFFVAFYSPFIAHWPLLPELVSLASISPERYALTQQRLCFYHLITLIFIMLHALAVVFLKIVLSMPLWLYVQI